MDIVFLYSNATMFWLLKCMMTCRYAKSINNNQCSEHNLNHEDRYSKILVQWIKPCSLFCMLKSCSQVGYILHTIEICLHGQRWFQKFNGPDIILKGNSYFLISFSCYAYRSHILIHKGSGKDTGSSIPLVVWLSLHDCCARSKQLVFYLSWKSTLIVLLIIAISNHP